jgi:hypothetical protein
LLLLLLLLLLWLLCLLLWLLCLLLLLLLGALFLTWIGRARASVQARVCRRRRVCAHAFEVLLQYTNLFLTMGLLRLLRLLRLLLGLRWRHVLLLLLRLGRRTE